jgi:sRNA-binding protein
MEKTSRTAKAREFYELLMSRFSVFKTFKPLAIGIREAVKAEFPDVDDGTLHDAFLLHCYRPRYVESIARGGNRFDLNSEVVGEVSAHDIEMAEKWLETRRKERQTHETERDRRIRLNEEFHAKRRARRMGRRPPGSGFPSTNETKSPEERAPAKDRKPPSERKPVVVVMRKKRTIGPGD